MTLPSVAKYLSQHLKPVHLSDGMFYNDSIARQQPVVCLLLLRQRVIAPRFVG
jgi:hypothetical protein